MRIVFRDIMYKIAVILLLLLFGVQSVNAIEDVGVAIDVAGSQRMLSQRMLKSYCLVVLDVKTEKFKSELDENIRRFERQLSDLQNFSTSNVQKRRFGEVQDVWQPMKKLLSESPKRVHVEELKDYSELLLRASQAAVESLFPSEKDPKLEIVDLSGRQRMLSQRMANRYMLKALGFSEDTYKDDLATASNEFKNTLDILMKSELNTEEINKGLKRVKSQYSLLDFSLNKNRQETFPFSVSDASDKILKLMHNITGQYAELVNQ